MGLGVKFLAASVVLSCAMVVDSSVVSSINRLELGRIQSRLTNSKSQLRKSSSTVESPIPGLGHSVPSLASIFKNAHPGNVEENLIADVPTAELNVFGGTPLVKSNLRDITSLTVKPSAPIQQTFAETTVRLLSTIKPDYSPINSQISETKQANVANKPFSNINLSSSGGDLVIPTPPPALEAIISFIKFTTSTLGSTSTTTEVTTHSDPSTTTIIHTTPGTTATEQTTSSSSTDSTTTEQATSPTTETTPMSSTPDASSSTEQTTTTTTEQATSTTAETSSTAEEVTSITTLISSTTEDAILTTPGTSTPTEDVSSTTTTISSTTEDTISTTAGTSTTTEEFTTAVTSTTTEEATSTTAESSSTDSSSTLLDSTPTTEVTSTTAPEESTSTAAQSSLNTEESTTSTTSSSAEETTATTMYTADVTASSTITTTEEPTTTSAAVSNSISGGSSSLSNQTNAIILISNLLPSNASDGNQLSTLGALISPGIANDNPFNSAVGQIQTTGTQLLNGNNATNLFGAAAGGIQGIANQFTNISAVTVPTLGDVPVGSSQDTGFIGTIQQIGSLIGNPLGSSNTSNHSASAGSGGILSQFQTVGSQISGGVTNASSAFVGSSNSADNNSTNVDGVSSQIQTIGSQVAGGFSNVTGGFLNLTNQFTNVTGITIPILGDVPVSPELPPGISQDTSIIGNFQQLGSLITNPFGGNKTNSSSVSTGSGGLISQFQTVGSQISGGVTNVSSAFIGSGSSVDNNSTNVDGVSSQISTIGSQTAGGFSNVTGGFQNITNQFTGISIPVLGDVPANPELPPGTSQDSSILGNFQQLGSLITNPFGTNNTNNSSGSTESGGILSQFQAVGSQIFTGLTNISNTFVGSSNSTDKNSTNVNGVSSQIQTIGSQIAGSLSNVTGGFQNITNQFTNVSGVTIPILGDVPVSPELPPGIPQDTSIIGNLQQLGSSITNPFTGSTTNESSGATGSGGILSQFQTVGSQISGGISNTSSTLIGSNNSTDKNSTNTNGVSSQIQTIGSEIAGGFSNVTGDFQNITNQFASVTIPVLGDIPANPEILTGVSQDSSIAGNFQQLGSLITNPFGSNNTNNSSGSAGSGGILSQFQNVGSQISASLTNISNTFVGSSNGTNNNGTNVDGVSSQIQTIGSQISGGFSNVTGGFQNITNQFAGVTIPVLGDVPVINELPTGTLQDPSIPGSFQQLGTLITNPFGSSNANGSSGSAESGGILSQFQTVGSQISASLTNVSSAFIGSSNNTNNNSTNVDGVNSQIQTIGSQIAAGFSNVTGGLQNITNQFTNVSGVTIPTLGDVPASNEIPSDISQDTSIIGNFQQLGSLVSNPFASSNSSNNSGPTASEGIVSQFQTVGSQITGGITNLSNTFIGSSNSSNNNATSPYGINSQIQTVGSQIVGGFSNASGGFQNITNQFTGVTIPVFGDAPSANELPSEISQDTSITGNLQQLGSLITNPFGPSNTNNSSNSTGLGGIYTQLQNLGGEISSGVSNTSSGLQGIANQFSNTSGITIPPLGDAPVTNNATSSQNPSLLGTFQQLGSLITNRGNNTNDSSAISSQLQNLIGFVNPPSLVGVLNDASESNGNNGSGTTSLINNLASQFMGGSPNISIFFAGLSNGLTSNSTNNAAIVSQLQNLGSQLLGKPSNGTNAQNITNLAGVSSQLQSLVANRPSNFTNPNTGSTRKDDAGIQELFHQLNTYTVSQSTNQLIDTLNTNSVSQQQDEVVAQVQHIAPSISNDVGNFASQIQNFGSQLLSTNGALNWNTLNQIPVVGNWFGSNNRPSDVNARPTLSCPACEQVCGTMNTAATRRLRVIGGSAVEPPNKYPWTARFIYFNSDAGQGSLINDRVILTTATTVNSMPLFSQASVLFNVYDLQSTTEQRHVQKIARVVPHPQFDPNNPYDNNIGIVIVDGPVPLSKTFVPICLPTSFDSYGGTQAVVAGWGSNSLGGQPSPIPQEVTIPLYSYYECKMTNAKLTNNNLCGGIVKPAPEGSLVSTCEGDDGAGLMAPSRINHTQMTLIGITVQVPCEGCGEPNQPAVFTNVQNYIDFIIYYGIGCGC
ncbi:serine-rich adhesin for platelets-like [Topomyia yanbarensis]|uniref:serine-rich adhesin for platelets-like n=1 Tax=Topomyia yanbarensis TaxID=2498891 RepID=UPI00273B99B8|nr:serine-rich adhesin for platelets-like [Topomyia yanbarensis]